MAHITVNSDQAKTILESSEQVEIRDASGKHLGFVAHQFSDEDIAIARERLTSEERRLSTHEVLNDLELYEQ